MVLLPEGATLADLVPHDARAPAARSPVLIPTWGWPDDNAEDAGTRRPASRPSRAGSTRPRRPTGAGATSRCSTTGPTPSGPSRSARWSSTTTEIDRDLLADPTRASTPTRRSPPATSTRSASCATPARSCSAATSGVCRFETQTAGRSRRCTSCTRRSPTPTPARRRAQGRAVHACTGLARPGRRGAAGPAARRRRSSAPHEGPGGARWLSARSSRSRRRGGGLLRLRRRVLGENVRPRRRHPRPRRRPQRKAAARRRFPTAPIGLDQGLPRRGQPRRRGRRRSCSPTSLQLLDVVTGNIEVWATPTSTTWIRRRRHCRGAGPRPDRPASAPTTCGCGGHGSPRSCRRWRR